MKNTNNFKTNFIKTDKFSKSHYDLSNCLSKLYCWYVFSFLYQHYQKSFDLDSIDICNRHDRCDRLGGRLHKNWQIELARPKCEKTKSKPSLVKALLRTFGLQYLFQNCKNFLVYGIFRMALPIFLGRIIHYSNAYYEERAENGNHTAENHHLFANNSNFLTLQSSNSSNYDPINSWLKLGNRQNVILNSCLLGLIIFVNFCISHPYFMCKFRYGMNCRVAVTRLVYEKALKVTGSAVQRITTGKITNLISNDASRFDLAYIFVGYIYLSPIETTIGIWLLYGYIGRSAFGALALVLVYIPFQTVMANVLSRFRAASASLTDDRLRLMAEILPAMKVIKMYFWEKSFAKLVHTARKLEITKIRQSMILRSLNLALYFVAPKVIAFVCIILFLLDGGTLNAENVFVTLSLVAHIRDVITYLFPLGVSNCVELYISIKRIEKFLLEKEVEPISNGITEKTNELLALSEITLTTSIGPSVVFDHLNVVSEEGVPILRDISFSVQPGQLTVIIGSVGSGKSSLLLSVLGELPSSGVTVTGEESKPPTMAYASQEAWIFAGTVRENILFGRPFEAARYREVVSLAALKADFAQFGPSGDLTLVEERGVSLSGGQRARLGLARALYVDADILLLDDPLSAVDATVAKHIFQRCIKDHLCSENEGQRPKVVLLVTHQLQFVKQADQIVVLKEGGSLLAAGSYLQLLNRGIDLYKYSAAASSAEVSTSSEQIVPSTPELARKLVRTDSTGSTELLRTCSRSTSVLDSSDLSEVVSLAEDQVSILDYMNSLPRQASRIDSPTNESHSVNVDSSGNDATQTCKENIKETKSKLHIYWIYISAGANVWLFATFLFFNFSTQILFTGSDYWLSAWTDFKEKSAIQKEDPQFNFTKNPIVANNDQSNIIIYSALVVALFTFSIGRTVSYFVICMRSSVVLHNRIFSSLMQAPIAFFDSTPIGIILNRVSRDLGIVDDTLPPTAFEAIEILGNSAAIFILISILNYIIIFPFLLLMALIYFANRFYVNTARNLKRLEAVARSPLFSQMSSTLNGLATIRSYKMEKLLIERFAAVQDRHTATYFTFISASRLYGIFLEAICVLYVYILMLVLNIKLDDYNGALIGLSLSQSLQLTNTFNWGIRQYAEVETYMTSIERIAEFGQLEREQQLESGPVEPDATWPAKGEIVFEDVSLSYKNFAKKEENDEEDTLVLKNLNFRISGGEKVGIVGRTGAGKSSLISLLYRLCPPSSGRVLIDRVDTSEISLKKLRGQALSIIPQEPVLFSGSLRRNLDPFGEHSDDQIWDVLEAVQLKTKVRGLGKGELDRESSLIEGEFSVGQKQLLCLGRALLRKNRILILDEATSNCDLRTDALIQTAIRSMDSTDSTGSTTLLTIAHRLHTIIDYDRVLVLDQGRLVQFDSPHSLIQAKEGVFFELFSSLNADARTELAKQAEKVHQQKMQLKEKTL